MLFLEEMCAPERQRAIQTVISDKSVILWGCIIVLDKGNLHFCDGSINAEKYSEILEQHMLSSPGTYVHSSMRQCKTTLCTHYNGSAEKEQATCTGVTCLQS